MPGNKDITHDELIKLLHLPEKLVAKELGICLTSLKKTCRIHGILRWPYRKIKSLDKKLSKLESAMTAPGTSKEDQSSLKEKLDQLQKERKNLPYRPARSVSSSADLEEDEASNSDSDRSSPVSTPSTVVASPSAMATAAAETEGGFEREANKLEKKLMQQKIRQAKKAKTANGKSNGHAGGVVEGQVTHVIPLPSLMNQQQSGGDSSMKLELTLPADIAEEISKGRATFKIVQNPGQTPELHLISLVTEEPTLEEDFFDMDDNMLPDDQDLDLQPFGDDTGHQDHDHSLDDSLLSMGDAHAARAESEENKNSNHAPVNHAPIVHAPAAKVATGNPVGDLNGVKKEQRPASAAEVLCGALSPGVGTGSSAWVRPKQSQTNGNSETSSAAQPHPVDIVSPNSASLLDCLASQPASANEDSKEANSMLALDCSASSERRGAVKAGSLSPGVIPADLMNGSSHLSPGNLLGNDFNLFDEGDDSEKPESGPVNGVENDDDLILSLSEAAS